MHCTYVSNSFKQLVELESFESGLSFSATAKLILVGRLFFFDLNFVCDPVEK